MLRRNKEEGTKVVEISEMENSDENDIDMIPLNASWSVMDKASQNKKRFAFEVREEKREREREREGERRGRGGGRIPSLIQLDSCHRNYTVYIHVTVPVR